jgi:oligopeptide/dipeptide ABC transporter ATP-binding protein
MTPVAPPPLLSVEHVGVEFPVRSSVVGRSSGTVRAVDDVSFTVADGETVGIVGESGCGKTTLSRCIVRLLKPQRGAITFHGRDITKLSDRALRPIRRQMQMVFQNPYASLNPHRRVGGIIAGALPKRIGSGQEADDRVAGLLEKVGLKPEMADRFPAEFSGGQRQRIGIARALAAEPKLIVLDEPVSALDVSVQAQVVNLLGELQEELGLAYVFVAHDLSVVRHVSDRIAVMYLGRFVEMAPADLLYAEPRHWYTRGLLDAVPTPTLKARRSSSRAILKGEAGTVLDAPSGCAFRNRCPGATEICTTTVPPLVEEPDGRAVACHHPLGAPGS